jgi:hypothetical protein
MKKYRSLEDVYNNIGQTVAPIPSQIINEWTILAADEGISPIKIGDVDEKFLNRLKKEINHHQGGVDDLLAKLINSGKWNTGMNKGEYEDKVLHTAVRAFRDIPENTNPDALKQLIQNKDNLTGFADAINDAADNNTDFNYLDSLEEVASTVFTGNVRALLDRLYALDFQQNTVSVGKGEFVATLFSNAKKGETGDLDIPGLGEVEIKGTQGRPGKTGGKLMGSRVKLPEMLLDIGKSRDDEKGERHDIYTGKAIQKFLLNLTKSINELKGYIASLRDNPKFTEIQGVPVGENIQNIYDSIEQITDPDTIKTITQTDFGGYLKELGKTIATSGLPKTQINTILSKLYKGTNSKPGLEKTFQEYHHSKDRKTIDAANEKEYTWSDVVKQYFMGEKWGLEKPDIVNGFVQLANEDLDDQETSQLREALTRIVDDDLMNELKAGNKTVLDAVVATIHSVLYQHKGDFPIMLLVNSQTKKALPLRYPGRDLKEKFLNHFDTIVDLIAAGKLKIGLSVDPRSKGVQFTYTG